MRVNIRRVIQAAVTGWAGMTGLITAARRAGITWTDIIGIEGAFFAEPNSRQARVIGSVVHLGMCVWIAFAYLLGFRATGIRPSWKTGAVGGLIHWLIASLVAGIVTKKHPKRADLALPGFGGTALGRRSVLGFLASHLVFGTLVGWQYGQNDDE
jgi:hypothetical protein